MNARADVGSGGTGTDAGETGGALGGIETLGATKVERSRHGDSPDLGLRTERTSASTARTGTLRNGV